ncbi:hypothetical protein Bpfe_020164 [Biomphalaria pfeifferi]|uniref:Uncharacterized protein n=1 Tax=Biomphalaria pfeifferi TaxID=112525 RepID=A0AAD8B9M3_BIOPF|nr:hypothetical protein Bpfe_020164 [Biomphalaria pfeifferi]
MATDKEFLHRTKLRLIDRLLLPEVSFQSKQISASFWAAELHKARRSDPMSPPSLGNSFILLLCDPEEPIFPLAAFPDFRHVGWLGVRFYRPGSVFYVTFPLES